MARRKKFRGKTDPQKLKEVFAVFKQVFNKKMPAGDLIRAAHAFIELYDALDVESYGDLGYSTREAFFAAAVDQAMTDGGWRILGHEAKIGMELCDDLPDNYLTVRAKIRGLVGSTEWPRIGMG
jgi:hypothetical protein